MSNPIVILIKAEGKNSAEVEAAVEKCVLELSEKQTRHYMKMGKFKPEDIDKLVASAAKKAAAQKKVDAEKAAAEAKARGEARMKARQQAKTKEQAKAAPPAAPPAAPKAEAEPKPKKTKKSKK